MSVVSVVSTVSVVGVVSGSCRGSVSHGVSVVGRSVTECVVLCCAGGAVDCTVVPYCHCCTVCGGVSVAVAVAVDCRPRRRYEDDGRPAYRRLTNVFDQYISSL